MSFRGMDKGDNKQRSRILRFKEISMNIRNFWFGIFCMNFCICSVEYSIIFWKSPSKNLNIGISGWRDKQYFIATLNPHWLKHSTISGAMHASFCNRYQTLNFPMVFMQQGTKACIATPLIKFNKLNLTFLNSPFKNRTRGIFKLGWLL